MSELPLEHNWSGWPGAWCLNCGKTEVTESALGCPHCKWSGGPYDIDDAKYCALHSEWAHTQAQPCRGPKDAHNPYVGKP